jgi:ribosome recycling factor
MAVKEVLLRAEDHMKKSLDVMGREFTQMRSGRASTTLIEHIKVEAYGNVVPLNQVASLSAPDAHSLMVQPWDRSLIKVIEKAIQKSELGLNPSNDGVVLRIPIPRLTEERRHEIVKVVKKLAEETKVALRRIRGDAIKDVEKLEKDKLISEDNMHDAVSDIQKLTEEYVVLVDKSAAEKEKEIMQV